MDDPPEPDCGLLIGHPRDVHSPGEVTGQPPDGHVGVSHELQHGGDPLAGDDVEHGGISLVPDCGSRHGSDHQGCLATTLAQHDDKSTKQSSNSDRQPHDRNKQDVVGVLLLDDLPERDGSKRIRLCAVDAAAAAASAAGVKVAVNASHNTSKKVLNAVYFQEQFIQTCSAEAARSCWSVSTSFREMALKILGLRVASADPGQTKVAAAALRRLLVRAKRDPSTWLFTKLAPLVARLLSSGAALCLGWPALDLALAARSQPTSNTEVDAAGAQQQLQYLVERNTRHPKAFDIAGRCLDIPNGELRIAALCALQHMAGWGDKAGVQGQSPVIAGCLEDAQRKVRVQALITLQAFSEAGRADDVRRVVLHALQPALEADDPEIRCQALRTWGAWGREALNRVTPEDSARHAAVAARDLGHHLADVRRQACETLGDLRHTSLAHARQVAALVADESAVVRSEAFLTLRRWDAQSVWQEFGEHQFRCTLAAAVQRRDRDDDERRNAFHLANIWSSFLEQRAKQTERGGCLVQ